MPISIYVAAAVFGALFVGWGLVSGDDADLSDASDDGGAWALLSVRSAAFGTLTFGAVGLLATLGRWSQAMTVVLATLLGVTTWVMVGLLFRHLHTSQSGAMTSDASWLGSEAELVVPFGTDGTGRISLLLGAQVSELAARRASRFAALPSAHFARCVVDDVEDGVAIVVPLAAAVSSPPLPLTGA